jgi:hypothetical protein
MLLNIKIGSLKRDKNIILLSNYYKISVAKVHSLNCLNIASYFDSVT